MIDITVEELLRSKEFIPVDVRSPIEHEEARIPGAVNIPLFTNEEREEIGILYKKSGNQAAKWRAMEIVSPKLPSLLKQIKLLEDSGAKPVVHCWRGGSRSKAVATFLELSGISTLRLAGGYRAYREYILEQIPNLLPQNAVVLHGFTGTGKTEILKVLEGNQLPVLDLEQMANHRGSLFGTIGIGNGHNQKIFDALLFDRLDEINSSDYFIVEAESKRIGRAIQPDFMMERKRTGTHFLIECSFENRVNRIYGEYVQPYKNEKWFQNEVKAKIEKIEKRLKRPELVQSLEEATEAHDYETVISILLEHYYDPRYNHTIKDYVGDFTVINGVDSTKAAIEIMNHLENRFPVKIKTGQSS
ncbi:tRNA 2-selenouridine(34) synthase MnmH [Mesobacillus maritimus]|uniref:tRNA 2-selenouridine(34) synthase MnmH n=1 Tax=Mesobacillus maritimus TaxID=1643336 RepID=UPI0020400D31|nr:tRNA 2-selenouridine(34) synthase MnmH [Mesobacillus maritimus]MCM3668408.1 tRNA 2-selenouridine(34) synthase MnmH [Mesobacillus maritimus]